LAQAIVAQGGDALPQLVTMRSLRRS